MQAIVTFITAAALALHCALGCCAHHIHANKGAACPDHANVAIHHHDCNGHDRHDHKSQQPSEESPADSGCPESHCTGNHCVFVAAGKTIVAKAAFAAVLPPFIAEPAFLVSMSPLAALAIDSGGQIALPIRTHLLNQVLLI